MRFKALSAFALAAALCGGVARAETTNDWLAYNGSYAGDRYSTLAQINRGNVASLHPVCAFQLGELGPAQTAPVVVNGTAYVTGDDTTFALDARTCTLKWKNTYTDKGPKNGLANRGVAYLDGKLFRGTPDSHLIAIDAATGKTLWDVSVSDPADGSNTPSAPLAWNGKVFIGIAGSEFGVKGRVMGFSADDGHRLWTFSTIPAGNEPGANTWGNAAAMATGGGGMWSTYTLDVASGTLLVPVGNPAPDFSADYRPGANLFTNSIVALDANTGKLRWWYQAVPHDFHDWDVAAAPALFTAANGEPLVAIGAKSGYLYTVDERTHKLVAKTAVTTIQDADKPITTEGTHFCPGTLGGVEWNGPGYSPLDKLAYVNSVDWCTTGKLGEIRYVKGQMFLGSANGTGAKDPTNSGWLTAVDPLTGRVAWRYHAKSIMIAAVTPTAGGLVFTGETTGEFDAFDSSNGKLLYQFNTGGSLAGGIATYAVDGKQYVAAMSGNQSRTSVRGGGAPTLFVFSL